MASFNRGAAIVLAVALFAAGLLLLAVVLFLPGPYTVTASNGEQYVFSTLSAADKLMTGAIGLVLWLAGLFLFFAELVGPPARQQLPLHGLEFDGATVDRQSVEERLAAVLRQLPGVQQATPRVRYSSRDVAVEAQLVTAPSVVVPALCAQAHALIQQTVEHDLGLVPGAVQIRVRLARVPDSADSAALQA